MPVLMPVLLNDNFWLDDLAHNTHDFFWYSLLPPPLSRMMDDIETSIVDDNATNKNLSIRIILPRSWRQTNSERWSCHPIYQKEIRNTPHPDRKCGPDCQKRFDPHRNLCSYFFNKILFYSSKKHFTGRWHLVPRKMVLVVILSWWTIPVPLDSI